MMALNRKVLTFTFTLFPLVGPCGAAASGSAPTLLDARACDESGIPAPSPESHPKPAAQFVSNELGDTITVFGETPDLALETYRANTRLLRWLHEGLEKERRKNRVFTMTILGAKVSFALAAPTYPKTGSMRQ